VSMDALCTSVSSVFVCTKAVTISFAVYRKLGYACVHIALQLVILVTTSSYQ